MVYIMFKGLSREYSTLFRNNPWTTTSNSQTTSTTIANMELLLNSDITTQQVIENNTKEDEVCLNVTSFTHLTSNDWNYLPVTEPPIMKFICEHNLPSAKVPAKLKNKYYCAKWKI